MAGEKKGAGAVDRTPGRPAFWALIVLSVLTLAAGFWRLGVERQQAVEQSRPAAGNPSRSRAPDFELQTVDGATAGITDFRGKVVLLNFWATWCPPCKAEMPDLNALHRSHGDTRGFTVVGINLEETASDVRDFAAQHQLAFPLLLDSDGQVTSKLFAIRTLPTSMIIDRDGFIRDAWTGQLAKGAILARLERVW